MLVRTRGALALALVSLLLLACGHAQAAPGGDLAKRQAAKALDNDGYVPRLYKAAASEIDEVEPNDTVAQANVALVGNAVRAEFADPSDEDWFVVSGASGYLAISTSELAGSATDTYLEVFAADGTTLLATDDDLGMGLFSAVRHLEVPVDGTVTVRVTRYAPVGDNTYTLAIEPDTAPPPVPENDTIATATVMETCSGIQIAGTLGASNSLSGLPCVAYDPVGPDVFYRLELPYSYQLTLVLQIQGAWDGALYLFTDPLDPAGSCLVGADDGYTGEAEQIVYVNESVDEQSMTVYMAVDSWDPSQYGEFLLESRCEFVVPVEVSSWGVLKSQF